MKYYLIAGERSGDLHGSNLLKSLKEKDDCAEFRGIGGDLMQSEGMQVIVPYANMAFMGFWEVLINLTTITKYLKSTKEDILEYKPDVLILIDYPGFNMRMAKFASTEGIKVYYYISPKIWAWNTKRAYKIKKWVDKMFTILPFETDFYKKFDVEVDYVGNPVMDAVKNYQFDQDFAVTNGIDPSKTISVLPGSRQQEVRSFTRQILKIAEAMPEYDFTVSMVDNLKEELYAPVEGIDNIKLIVGNTYDLVKNSMAAIVTSGTATLETAVINVPQVVCYKTSPLSYSIAKRLIKVPFISLVNLIMNREVVKELIQDDLNTSNLKRELELIISKSQQRSKILSEYTELRRMLGDQEVSGLVATKMHDYLTAE